MQLRTGRKQLLTWIKEDSLRGEGLRFVLFLCIYSLVRYLELLFYSAPFGQALLNPLHEDLSYFISHICCFLLKGLYPDIHTSVNHIIFLADKATIQLLPGCTGLGHMIRVGFALLLYPMSWVKKCYLFFPSLLIILFAATIHFLLLIPIAFYYPNSFALAHDYFAKLLFFGFIFLCWMIWERCRSDEVIK